MASQNTIEFAEIIESITKTPQLVKDLIDVLNKSQDRLEASQNREVAVRREAEANQMLTINEACHYLGGISAVTLNNYMNHGLNYYKKGKSVWYRRGDIDAWLESGKVNRHSR